VVKTEKDLIRPVVPATVVIAATNVVSNEKIQRVSDNLILQNLKVLTSKFVNWSSIKLKWVK
jgi:hypothetical protein